MGEKKDDYHDLLDQTRFLGEIEQGVRLANREIIQAAIPDLTKDAILTLAVVVGRLRARYLKVAFGLSVNEEGEIPNTADIAEVRKRRENFEEARDAFEALRHAIEKGYTNVRDSAD
ncbi:MAG: hypothetical protein QGI06_08640 [Rhodospirillales bacterium]|jgi:hypothetical protein|nr:hypothetical protein [Rhodospirillales bacterium]